MWTKCVYDTCSYAHARHLLSLSPSTSPLYSRGLGRFTSKLFIYRLRTLVCHYPLPFICLPTMVTYILFNNFPPPFKTHKNPRIYYLLLPVMCSASLPTTLTIVAPYVQLACHQYIDRHSLVHISSCVIWVLWIIRHRLQNILKEGYNWPCT